MSLNLRRMELVTDATANGVRLDRWVAERCPNLSRARVQELIEQGLVLVNDAPSKPAYKLRAADKVFVEAQERPPLTAEPEAIPLQILYEDDDVLVVNKPAGMSVHAGAGNSRGTLVNALLGRGQSLSRGGDLSHGGAVADDLRPGIVHRLDKETSGAMVIAKNDFAHAKLAEAFSTRAVKKTYLALAEGKLEKRSGKIDLPIGRDPLRRTRMKAFLPALAQSRRNLAGGARSALTDWKTLAELGPATLVEVQLHTGRTHQIRVHFSALKHPLVGDTLYGASSHLRAAQTAMPALGRQFLHSATLGFPHPRTGAWIEAHAPLAPDLRDYLDRLAAATGHHLPELERKNGA
jgi:23S rRNA pseudouridine1911/1915/1917 synthase